MKRIFVIIAVLFAAMFVSASLECALELTWANSELLENNAGYNAGDAQVAVDANIAVAVWKQLDSSGFYRIYSNYSNDGGATWHSDLRIDDDGDADAEAPQVAVSGSNVVVVWSQSKGGIYNIYSDYSTDGGATWHSDRFPESGSGNAREPQVAMDGNNVVTVWRQEEPGSNIYSNYSTDGGASWHTAVGLESGSLNAMSPQVVMDGSNVVAVWYQYDGGVPNARRIYSNYSTNTGASWGVSAQLIENNAGYEGFLPEVAMDGANVVAVWRQSDGTANRVYSNYSTNYGVTWVPANTQLIENNAGRPADSTALAISGNSVVAVWKQDDGTDWRIYSNYSSDGGVTWVPANTQRIENNSGQAQNPDVAMSVTTAVAVWYQQDAGGDFRVYSSYSTDGGANWSPDKIIDTNEGYSAQTPQVAIYGDIPVAVWYQQDSSAYSVYASYAEFVDVPASGGCFIATAAFGSPLEKHVTTLREFRDNHLLTNKSGRAFVKWYYRHSPSLADYIRRRPAARVLVRTFLRPLAWLVSLL